MKAKSVPIYAVLPTINIHTTAALPRMKNLSEEEKMYSFRERIKLCFLSAGVTAAFLSIDHKMSTPDMLTGITIAWLIVSILCLLGFIALDAT